jgi:hypothetical protein
MVVLAFLPAPLRLPPVDRISPGLISLSLPPAALNVHFRSGQQHKFAAILLDRSGAVQ